MLFLVFRCKWKWLVGLWHGGGWQWRSRLCQHMGDSVHNFGRIRMALIVWRAMSTLKSEFLVLNLNSLFLVFRYPWGELLLSFVLVVFNVWTYLQSVPNNALRTRCCSCRSVHCPLLVSYISMHVFALRVYCHLQNENALTWKIELARFSVHQFLKVSKL